MTNRPVSDETLSQLLELIYPIHYKWGFALEEILRYGALTPLQIAVLWLLRCEGGDEHLMRRKDIQQFLAAWFEASNSTVTKALRSMSKPPLNLVKVLEHPDSGREKQVLLTPKGEQFFGQMLDRCRTFLGPIVDQIGEEEVRQGAQYLKKWIAAVETLAIVSFPKSGITPRRDRAAAAYSAGASELHPSSARERLLEPDAEKSTPQRPQSDASAS